MKILEDEERNAHWNTVLYEGAKGTVVGAGLAGLLVYGVKRRYPGSFAQLNASVKSAMWAMPTVGMAALFADEGSVRFDEQTHRGSYLDKIEQEKTAAWEKLSTGDKIFTYVNDHKYKLIVGAWAGSLWGSWSLVNRDKIMTKSQKAVQARVYAQAITVILLLGTLLLSMREREIAAGKPAPMPEWKRYLEEQKHNQEHAQGQEQKLSKQAEA